MEKSFNKTDKNKREAIINAAFEEFATNSYEKASTNNIVKKAGISKGLLYHYFKSKKALYEYLEVFSLKTIAEPIIEGIDWHEPDLFLRIEKIITIKFEILSKYPQIVNFTKMMPNNKSKDELKDFIEKHIPDAYLRVYTDGIDFNRFKAGLDIDRAMHVIQWTFEKLGEDWNNSFVTREDFDRNLHTLKAEITLYINMLKDAFYK